jgi:uncharacterized tellurite resistance protein B-like protein
MKELSENPISNVFGDLPKNQKMSIINLLSCIAACDSTQPIRAELEYIHVFNEMLDVSDDDCFAYFDTQEVPRMIADLQTLTQYQKEFLAFVTFELIECDGKPNKTEERAFESFFDKLGIRRQKIHEILQKQQTLKHFFKF